MSVLLETSAGDLVIDLLTEEAPKACLNFLKLCKAKYYNFSPIYNIQAPSFFQSGDPEYPLGSGGVSCWGLQDPTKRFFKPDFPNYRHERGTISMVCTDALSASQFIVSMDSNPSFDAQHSIFGRLAEGEEVMDIIASQSVDEGFRAFKDIRILHTIILEDPFPDPESYEARNESPEPSEVQIRTMRIGYDETLEEDMNEEDLEQRARKREAENNALTLETIGDLPFAAIRPPENILFVCKLNPVTPSSDLELIFGRFGHIISCHVVKDRKTGDSLQYAFIEFDRKEDAERAYFKMQGVLVDDRRIHVDFSQSVAKTVDRRRRGDPYRDDDRRRRQSPDRRKSPDPRRRDRSPRHRRSRSRDRYRRTR